MKKITAQGLQVLDLPVWNFEIHAGECVFMSGPSGCGKTVLLRAIADLDVHKGVVELDGVAASTMPAHGWRKQVALVPAETHWWHATVEEHMLQPDETQLAVFGFEADVMQWQVNRLSTGEKQRLGLLRALEQQPQVLLLDEPTANLDQEYTHRVERFINDMVKNNRLAVIWVTHDQQQQLRIAKRGWMIDQNEIREINA